MLYLYGIHLYFFSALQVKGPGAGDPLRLCSLYKVTPLAVTPWQLDAGGGGGGGGGADV